MHQSSIDLPWLHPAIFESQDRSLRIDGPWRSERRENQRQAAAEYRSLGGSTNQRFALELGGPSAGRSRSRLLERGSIVTTCQVLSGVESSRDHRTVKCDPAAFLPKKHLKRSDVAVADQHFRRRYFFHVVNFAKQFIEQIIRAVAASRANHGPSLRLANSREKFFDAIGNAACEIPFA